MWASAPLNGSELASWSPPTWPSPEPSRAALLAADLRFMNDEERGLLFGAGSPPPAPTVTKHGPGGASYYVAGGRTWHAPADRLTAVDTTHAGEILAGVFLALRTAAITPAAALRHAVRAATAKVTQFGVDGDRLTRTLAEIRTSVQRSPGRAALHGPADLPAGAVAGSPGSAGARPECGRGESDR